MTPPSGAAATGLDRALCVSGFLAMLLSVTVLLVDWAHPLFNDLPVLTAPLFGVAGLAAVRDWRLGRGVRQRNSPFAAWLLATIFWALSGWDRVGPLPTRVVVFGVDGATWSLIDKADLPAFSDVSRAGARGSLLSMEPMFSPLLWTTMASGRKPEDHGIRGFHVQAPDCRVARWWDIAEERGDAVGLYKWLVDYPPRSFKTGGFWVPSWLAPAPETWPASLAIVKEVELANRLRRKQVRSAESTWTTASRLVGVGVRLSTLLGAASWRLEERFGPGEVRRNVAMQIIRGNIDRDVFIAQLYAESPRVASLNYYATDGLAHLYWDRHEAGGTELLSAYRQADAILGELVARMAPEARLIVVSDHGFKAMDGSGEAGQFLPLTERLRARVSATVAPVDVTRVGHKLVVGAGSTEQAVEVRAWLAALPDASGRPFYAVGDFPDDPGSVALTLADEALSGERLARDTVGGEPISDYVTLSATYTGTHEEHGVMLLFGSGIAAGTDLGDVRLLDVAPTILAAAGHPASADMPGRAQGWTELPRVLSWDALVSGLSWQAGDEGGNEEMLEALGYTEGAPKPSPERPK